MPCWENGYGGLEKTRIGCGGFILATYGLRRDGWDINGPSHRCSSLWKCITSTKDNFATFIRYRVATGNKILFFGMIDGWVVDHQQLSLRIFTDAQETLRLRLAITWKETLTESLGRLYSEKFGADRGDASFTHGNPQVLCFAEGGVGQQSLDPPLKEW